jgi:hypothetical protein
MRLGEGIAGHRHCAAESVERALRFGEALGKELTIPVAVEAREERTRKKRRRRHERR